MNQTIPSRKWKDYIPTECQPIKRQYPPSNYSPWTVVRVWVTALILLGIFSLSMYLRYHVK